MYACSVTVISEESKIDDRRSRSSLSCNILKRHLFISSSDRVNSMTLLNVKPWKMQRKITQMFIQISHCNSYIKEIEVVESHECLQPERIWH